MTRAKIIILLGLGINRMDQISLSITSQSRSDTWLQA